MPASVALTSSRPYEPCVEMEVLGGFEVDSYGAWYFFRQHQSLELGNPLPYVNILEVPFSR